METVAQLLSIIGGIFLAFAYVPQIISLYKTKSADGISLSFWLILDTSLLVLFLTALIGWLLGGSLYIAVLQAMNIILALIVTGQVLYYRKRGNSK